MTFLVWIKPWCYQVQNLYLCNSCRVMTEDGLLSCCIWSHHTCYHKVVRDTGIGWAKYQCLYVGTVSECFFQSRAQRKWLSPVHLWLTQRVISQGITTSQIFTTMHSKQTWQQPPITPWCTAAVFWTQPHLGLWQVIISATVRGWNS